MEEAKFRDYYRDLGVSPGSAIREIKKAFYSLAKRHHPDKNGTGSTNSDEFRKASVHILITRPCALKGQNSDATHISEGQRSLRNPL
jgi:preprotein translocase subunit Sec63